MTDGRVDVAVVGAGPAGLALATALERRGVHALVIAPQERWAQTLGTWVDDLTACDDPERLRASLQTRWPIVTVTGRTQRHLHREYAVFNNDSLATALEPAHRLAEKVVGVTRSDDHYVVACRGGAQVLARLVVDCGGARSSLLHRHRRGEVLVQSAYGVFTEGQRLVAEGSFTMMDWSTSFGGHPTFLYAMDLGEGRALVEETSLVDRLDMPTAELRSRLYRRLGVEALEGEVETVSIPMGGRLPERSTTVVGFGAAAGFIHPVTGYSVASSLRAAPRVADAIARALADNHRGSALVERAWRAVWPDELVRTRALHDYGLSALRRLDTDSIGDFFDAFFAMPEADWSDYLRIDTKPGRVAAIMTRFFRSMPSGVRIRVMGTSPRALGRLLVRRS